MTKRTPIVVYEYPILMPFRHNGRWWRVEDKTIKLAPRQTPFLLRSGKIGSNNQVIESKTAVVSVQSVTKTKEVKNG